MAKVLNLAAYSSSIRARSFAKTPILSRNSTPFCVYPATASV
ncbi:unnamed protein product [Haemonchus placei]|uniref:Uncharacterized protein n=1 Tax=Haemonchus placei TaxID=6290 RepID=A0A3P7S9S7_HAEPC|nr:unnamed protein product [Haemonchus placei]